MKPPLRSTSPEDKPDYRLLKRGGDPYIYPATTSADAPTLRNRFGVRDAATLQALERQLSAIRLGELAQHRVVTPNTLEGLRALHQHVFQDVYHWAGHVRRINLQKSEPLLSGASVAYSDVQALRKEAKAAFESLREQFWADMDPSKKAAVFAEKVAEVWRVHPFREGNTRTVMTFAAKFSSERGFPLDTRLLGRNAAYVHGSLVVATLGHTDNLATIIKDALERGQTLAQSKRPALTLIEERER